MNWTESEINILEHLDFAITKSGASTNESEGMLWIKKQGSSVIGEIENDHNEVLIKKEAGNLKKLLEMFGYDCDDI